MFSLDILTKLPPEIREVASYIAEFSNSYAPEKTLSLVASFLLRFRIENELLLISNF